MGLADEVRAEPQRITRARVDELLGPKDAAEFAELLADPVVMQRSIFRALKRRGIPVSDRTISYWAREARGQL